VSKALILQALREAVSLECADSLKDLKREALIDAAERKLAGTRWLPEKLRAPALTAEGPEGTGADAAAEQPALAEAA